MKNHHDCWWWKTHDYGNPINKWWFNHEKTLWQIPWKPYKIPLKPYKIPLKAYKIPLKPYKIPVATIKTLWNPPIFPCHFHLSGSIPSWPSRPSTATGSTCRRRGRGGVRRLAQCADGKRTTGVSVVFSWCFMAIYPIRSMVLEYWPTLTHI